MPFGFACRPAPRRLHSAILQKLFGKAMGNNVKTAWSAGCRGNVALLSAQASCLAPALWQVACGRHNVYNGWRWRTTCCPATRATCRIALPCGLFGLLERPVWQGQAGRVATCCGPAHCAVGCIALQKLYKKRRPAGPPVIQSQYRPRRAASALRGRYVAKARLRMFISR